MAFPNKRLTCMGTVICDILAFSDVDIIFQKDFYQSVKFYRNKFSYLLFIPFRSIFKKYLVGEYYAASKRF